VLRSDSKGAPLDDDEGANRVRPPCRREQRDDAAVGEADEVRPVPEEAGDVLRIDRESGSAGGLRP